MHGLINRAIQCFVTDTYGTRLWTQISRDVGLGPHGFEAMLTYDDALTHAVLRHAAEQLNKPEIALLEDLGTYLCTGTGSRLRRLLRFGGDTFEEFLHSLDDLPDRAKLALPDLDVPGLELSDLGDGCYWLLVRHRLPRSAALISGVLRAMADDYGALVLLEPLAGPKYMPDGAPLTGPSPPVGEAAGALRGRVTDMPPAATGAPVSAPVSEPTGAPTGGMPPAPMADPTPGMSPEPMGDPTSAPLIAREPGSAFPHVGSRTLRYVTVIEIRLLDTTFHQGRSFSLAGICETPEPDGVEPAP